MKRGGEGKVALLAAVLLVGVYLLAVYGQWIDVKAGNLAWARRSELLAALETFAVAAAGVLLGTSVQRGVAQAAQRDAARARARAREADAAERESLAMRAAIAGRIGAPADRDELDRFAGTPVEGIMGGDPVRQALQEVLAAADAASTQRFKPPAPPE